MISVNLMNQVNCKSMNVKYKYCQIILIVLINITLGSNNHPIFLIHGFMGWGREELDNHYYWGGEEDLQKILAEEGFVIHTLSVGPISSNWDRAIEAYAQIKGGCVDYGNEHSSKYNIIQKPSQKCYEGIYPEWDENNPIHIIGHSQGGLTARMLEYLLELQINNEDSDLLSQEHINYIKSITTFSTPHNGTTLAFLINNKFPYLQKLSAYAGLFNGLIFKNYYNFDLDQWGLKKNKSETYYQFLQRINNSEIKSTENSASWDLSIPGAITFNKISQSNQNTYYFSYSTSASVLKKNSNKHKPNLTMNYYLRPASRLMGSDSNPPTIYWYENDGIVNTISMDGPHDEKIIQYNKKLMPGIWHHMGKLNYDHHQILLRKLDDYGKAEILNIYLGHCRLLYQL